ncbi:NB-ARC domain-containing protein [Streptomyces sp. NPDC048639]|uniref:NB-ARC domain-containing protein n=1 Tax=Streptomyces sp. NPDC048639 TaxID=3365581 RepID=UPI00371D5796
MTTATSGADSEPPVHMDGQAEGQSRLYMAGRDLHFNTFAAPTPPTNPLRTLPRDTASFTGRNSDLERIVQAAEHCADSAVPILVINGMPGVGKTALAIHAAHLLANRYSDGQIFVPLHAHTPGQRRADPAQILADLLPGIGVPSQHIPDTLDARSGLWRNRLLGKRTLLVLDDAAEHTQVEPLLPASGSSLVLVTSRHRIIALEGTEPITLNTLPPQEATQLFKRLAKRAPTELENQEVTEAVRTCGYLPLAISLLAARLSHHLTWPVSEFTRDFVQARDRLGELAIGSRAVAAAFDLSYRELPADRQRFFRHLGLHAGADIDAHAAAALDDIPITRARRQLEALYMDHLLDELSPGRYRFHDLVRAYARTIAQSPADAQDQSLQRILDHYLHTAEAADRQLRNSGTQPAVTTALTTSTPEINSAQDALAWLRTEKTNLLAYDQHTANHGRPEQALQFSAALRVFLRQEGDRRATSLHAAAVAAARSIRDQSEEAHALQRLFGAHCATGDYAAAAGAVEQALGLYRALADESGVADALHNLGQARRLTGDYAAAASIAQQALGQYRVLGDRHGEARARRSAGSTVW